jgi:5-methylcytosine-specific restriction endonuclease McrA
MSTRRDTTDEAWLRRRELQRIRSQRWRERHPDSSREYQRTYRATREEMLRASRAKWAKTNPERNAAAKRAWKAANPDRAQAHVLTRRARKRNATGRGVSPAEWREALAASLGLCAYCNGTLTPPTFDHIDPISRGGEHDVDNLAVACKPCNDSKGDTPLLVWLAK